MNRRPSQANFSKFEPPTKKRRLHHRDKTPQITKETLLKALSNVEDEVRSLKHHGLSERLKDLRGQVKVVLEKHKDEIKRLHAEINDLREQVDLLIVKNNDLIDENEKLMNKLHIAQATWLWEGHVARFVVDNSKEIYEFGRFKQMSLYLHSVKAKDNLWIKIKRNIAQWKRKHWNMVNTVRRERNGIAHPPFIDLDLIDAKLTKMFPDYREPMLNMLDILKTTASLMKFGRLAKFYQRKRLGGREKIVLEYIRSWDRRFEDIDGLQLVEHEDGKRYLAKYVNDPETIDHYFQVVDLIKNGNRTGMGKLAWELDKRHYICTRMTREEHEVVNKLKSLVPKGTRNVIPLQRDIAMLHIPDFLPKRFWKHGIKVLEKYFSAD